MTKKAYKVYLENGKVVKFCGVTSVVIYIKESDKRKYLRIYCRRRKKNKQISYIDKIYEIPIDEIAYFLH